MKRLLFICAAMGVLLGSAAPPAVGEAPTARPARAAPVPTRTVAKPVPRFAAAPELTEPAKVAAPPPARAVRPRPVVSGSVRVLVSLPAQRLWVFRGRELVATSPVSTGKRGHATPPGNFPILQKRVEHYSSRYDNAPMPYMQRLTHYGIALHGGRLPGYPASHGCIRLPHGFARRLYRMTDFNTRVVVTRARPRSTSHALALAH
jgi:lipoprotein-anchoring transpeptidase ErfK/SrfK